MGTVRFLLRPRWILGTLLVLVLAVSFVELGLWQLRRLDERRAFNAAVGRARRLPAKPLGQVAQPGSALDPASLVYRRVIVRGAYDPSREVILFGRSRNEQPGNHVLTPLRMDEETALIVDRGWVPISLATPPVAQAAPPPGRISVTGILWPAEALGAPGSEDGRITQLAKIDLGRIQAQLPYRIEPVYLWLQSQTPGQTSGVPAQIPLPTLDEGPHLSYAIQWFAFATIAVVGYALLVHREGRRPDPQDTSSGTDRAAAGSGT